MLAILRQCAITAQNTLRLHLGRVYKDTTLRLHEDAEFELYARSGRIMFMNRGREFTETLEAELADELETAMNHYVVWDPVASTSIEAESTVHGVDTFEQQVLYDRLTYRLSDPAEPQFRELGWRMAALRGIRKLPQRNNPLRAAVFFRAFARTLVRLDVYRPAVLPLTKALDFPMTEPLRDVYREVNHVLATSGVAAVREQTLPGNPDMGTFNSISYLVTDQRIEHAPGAGVRPATMPSTFDRIAVPAAAPAAEAPAATTAHAAPAFADEAQSLARSLARRMRYELIRLDAGHPPSIVKLSSVTGGTPVSKSTQIAVELVQGIFQSVIDDAAVPEEFRHLILHLQVPMLRLTLGHAEYVPTAKAPGRPLLTRLALASAGWSRVGEFNQRLLAAARAAVRTVVAQPDAGPQQLHSALHQFVAFLAEEAKADNSAVERIRRAREQADEREAMQVRVALEIGRKFERQPVPLYLRNFLLGPWVKVLCAARERDSIEPEFSAPFETLADEVLSSVAGQQPGADRGRQDLSIARMLATIYRGLAMIEMAPTDVKDLATALMNTHAAAAEGAESDEPDQPDSGLDWEATGASPPRESVARTQPR